MLHCERIETALRDRVWSLGPKPGLRRWTGLLVQGGGAVIEARETRLVLEPAMICLTPATHAQSLRMRAGSEGMLFSFDENSAPLVTGRGAEADLLRHLLDAPVQARLDRGDIALRDVEFALELVLRGQDSQAPGHLSIHDAALRIVLVAILRNLPATARVADHRDRSAALLQRFRHLLESRFRDRWTVAQYAEALGIGADRLHDLCTARLNKSPSRLIAERVMYEARLLLRNTPASVEEIAGRLGYRDPSHFSRAFSRMQNESPSRFRRRSAEAADQGRPAAIDFANWP